jgi:hypothetical protein
VADVSMNDSVTVPEGVLSRELEGETVLLNLETGVYFGLDPVATVMFTELRDRGSIRAALDALVETFDASPADIERDLLAFADSLIAKGLIQKSA